MIDVSPKVKHFWNTPFMDKWGRIILLFIACTPFYWFFHGTPSIQTQTDEFILISIICALALGAALSIATTEKYYARSLGLYGIIVGSLLYYSFVLLRYQHHNYMWMIDATRAIFLVSAWLFAIACLVTWRQQRRRDKKKTP
jgi:hypothetical protein